jgi:hypothetical protein
MPVFPAVFNLSSLTGSNGFRINGETGGDRAGTSVARAGDINGDGFSDILVGAFGRDLNGSEAGASYVIFGKASGFSGNLDLASLNGSNGFRISGKAAFDLSGGSVAGAGDINKDGFADLIIGAQGADPGGDFSGASYVVFGQAGGFAPNLNLSSLGGSNGFQISGELPFDFSGKTVSPAGDVNGDGFADLLIGSPGADPNGIESGASYVVFGRAAGFSASLGLSALNGSNGFQINGEAAGDRSGLALASAGDVNGDGFGDVIIGAYSADPNFDSAAGASYVVFGKAGGFGPNLNLSALNGSNGFRISGEVSGDYSGKSVASAGDVNGDGYADLIIGASGVDVGGSSAGASYVVFGQAGGFAANLNLSTLNGANGFQINGEAAGDQSGVSVASAGDVNGDGYGDLLIGAPGSDTGADGGGAAYVVFGKAAGFNANFSLAGLTGADGFKIIGQNSLDQNGFAVSSAGDVNGDGFSDLLVGQSGPDAGGTNPGHSYVIFGQGPDAAVDWVGNRGSQTFHAGAFNDRVDGAEGNDIIYGGEGQDALKGSEGNDILVGGGGNDVLFGGNGLDVAVFSGLKGSYSVTLINGVRTLIDNRGGRPDGIDSLTGIEEIRFADGQVTTRSLVNTGITIVGTSGNDILSPVKTAAGQSLVSDLGDFLYGLEGNDRLDGGLGADKMFGGLGNDTFVVDNVGDQTVELSGEGADRVLSSLSWTLADNIENLTLTGDQSVDGVGNELNNLLTGNAANNRLEGGLGNDILVGGDGNDILIGGVGADILTGGGGADRFLFAVSSDLKVNKTDTVMDFSHSDGDLIDLSGIDANGTRPGVAAFAFIGTSAFGLVAGQLRFEVTATGLTLQADTNGDGIVDLALLVTGVSALQATDLVL